MSGQSKENYKRLMGKNTKALDASKDVVLFGDIASFGYVPETGILSSISGSFVGAGGTSVFASGTNLVIASNIAESLFELNGSGSTVIQSDFNNVPGQALNSQFFGVDNSFNSYIYAINPTQYPTSSNFISGSGNVMNTDTWVGRASFIQGEGNYAYSYINFVQGLRNTILGGGSSFCVGFGNILTGGETACFGRQNAISGVSSSLCLGAGNSLQARYSASIGVGNNVRGTNGGTVIGEHDLTVGQSNLVFGNNNICVGKSNIVRADNSIAVGDNCLATGNGSFAQGNGARGVQERTFAHGDDCRAIRADQKTWGSNGGNGKQKSRMIKYLQTANATESTLATLDLEQNKAYSIRLMIAVKNSITNTESASFELPNALAYRDTGGAAVLINNPIAISGINSGGGSASWSTSLMSSGNNILLRVVGDAVDTTRWLADFEFAEVLGFG